MAARVGRVSLTFCLIYLSFDVNAIYVSLYQHPQQVSCALFEVDEAWTEKWCKLIEMLSDRQIKQQLKHENKFNIRYKNRYKIEPYFAIIEPDRDNFKYVK